jgi:hypothetical protein
MWKLRQPDIKNQVEQQAQRVSDGEQVQSETTIALDAFGLRSECQRASEGSSPGASGLEEGLCSIGNRYQHQPRHSIVICISA